LSLRYAVDLSRRTQIKGICSNAIYRVERWNEEKQEARRRGNTEKEEGHEQGEYRNEDERKGKPLRSLRRCGEKKLRGS
jgi:hypothetical protein